ncbi:hypothetical protein J9253_20365 [Thiothrix litoralis]|uniref:Membrane-anchored protein n=1 Tax=Thiothrix litoralis TaxID=2891210 RepID=A0ABX7WV86_9GAMM|nr:hypothetical protein [Thiothrix litoralis]QTR46293.1 hypothetical protein J9253_20365 [Thiothrix litoralis]
MNAITANSALIKVPIIITLYFWVIKILATTVGETGADFLIFNLNWGLPLTSALMSVVLVGFLFAQVKTKTYTPWLYWLTVVMVSIVGTLITDNLTDNLGVPLTVSTAAFSAVLAVTFWLWHKSEGSLSIHSIYTAKRELFYWAAILFTFALGTAAGDLLAESVGLGYAISALAFGAVIAVITIGFYAFKLNGILAFWLAYIITRPLGASIGDLLSQNVGNGGLGLGTMGTSAVFLVAIVGLVSYLTLSRVDAPKAVEGAV